MAIERFIAAATELRTGVSLIEASAGTGKTYAIAMLALRFIVEQAMSIEQLLIVTFTNAATDELKQRIRARLAEAKRALEGGETAVDASLQDWLQSQPVERDLARQRLQMALLDIDKAGIFTIHGFCQRVLREHALESGQVFDAELIGDDQAVRLQLAEDFWRQQVYPRSVWQAAQLTAQYHTPAELLNSIAPVSPGTPVYPELVSLDASLDSLQEAMQAALEIVQGSAAAVQQGMDAGKFKADFVRRYPERLQTLRHWLRQEDDCSLEDPGALALFTRDGLLDGLNGNQFRARQGLSKEQRSHEFVDSLGIQYAVFAILQERFRHVTLDFRRALLDYLQQHLDSQLQKMNVLSFDNLIQRFRDALLGSLGELLAAELRHRYRAALIDEFQDTDCNQWTIFSRLFARDSHFLFLIGDPKQAIYKFRGADIFSYFQAQRQAHQHYTLVQNWRSHPQLVQAVNVLFNSHERPFWFEMLHYIDIEPALSAEQGTLTRQGLPLPPMVLWQLQESDSGSGFWTSGKARQAVLRAVVGEILELLDRDLATAISSDKGDSPLQPQDIAILVRSNAQAREFQQALREVGIPAVLNSVESVFATSEAECLWQLLQALAHPGDLALLKQALTLDWFGLDGQKIYRISNDEAMLDAWLSRFQDYHQQWRERGLLAMMRQLLDREGVSVQLASTETAERRLTNLYHLLELLQQAAIDEHLSIRKTLQWLARAIALQNPGADDQQLRLESDAAAVRIVTLHRSKGLEFPVVFCPYLWLRSSNLKQEKNLLTCHEQGGMVVDLGSEDFSRRHALALQEELAEDLRVFYVAVTRAKYRCYLPWADVRTSNQANDSAMAYLLFAGAGEHWRQSLPGLDFAGQQAVLQKLAEGAGNCFAYRVLAAETGTTGRIYHREFPEAQTLKLLTRSRQLFSNWQMSSYSALSALSVDDAPELPLDKAQEVQLPAPAAAGEALPGGAHTGNVVHALLETISFQDLAQGADIARERDLACRRYGLTLETPELLDGLLQRTVTTPLSLDDAGFCLANLEASSCLKEMPFYLALQEIDVGRINAILQGTPGYQNLHRKKLQGYLTGFIDLVCRYRGRYYVMDYKTNCLPDYRPETLLQAMREHNYALQYWLYALVLHRYLQERLPDYRHAQHFGGVRYLFVRGMQPEQSLQGVFQTLPDLDRLERLGELLCGDQEGEGPWLP